MGGPRARSSPARAETAERQRLRVRSEDKDVIAAFHWRGAPDEDAAERAVREIAEQAEQEGFAVHWGRKVLEVRPPVEFDKGLGHRRAAARGGRGRGASTSATTRPTSTPSAACAG